MTILSRTRTPRPDEVEHQPADDGRRYIPCGDCGAAVTDELAHREVVTSQGYIHLTGANKLPYRVEKPQEAVISLCSACKLRERRAGELVDAHSGAVPYLRSRVLRVEAANGAMIAFEMLGMSWRDLFDEGSDRQVHMFIEALRAVGGEARYRLNLIPFVKPGFGQGVPLGAERWHHVTEPQRQAIREAYGQYLADRVDGPLAVPVPESGYGKAAMRGCMFCGVSSVVVPSRRISGVWGDMRRIPAHLVGGPGEPDPRRGYLCPACHEAADRMGIGRGAVDMAIATFLGMSRQEFERIDGGKVEKENLQGLRIGYLREVPVGPHPNDNLEPFKAWCALPVGTPPNPKPWAHLGDLSELGKALGRL